MFLQASGLEPKEIPWKHLVMSLSSCVQEYDGSLRATPTPLPFCAFKISGNVIF
jgi:hypothetical protein